MSKVKGIYFIEYLKEKYFIDFYKKYLGIKNKNVRYKVYIRNRYNYSSLQIEFNYYDYESDELIESKKVIILLNTTTIDIDLLLSSMGVGNLEEFRKLWK